MLGGQAELARCLHPSGAPEPDGYLGAFDNDGYLAFALGDFKHRIEVGGVLFHIDIIMLRVSLPGSASVRSARLAVDDYGVCHTSPPQIRVWEK